MATALRIFQLTAVPAVPVNNALYFIESANGNDAEAYITDATGALHNVGNTAMISAVANGLIASAFASQNSVEVFADIPARDAAGLAKNTLCVVKDASADPTVDAGAALYIYEITPDSFTKLAEFEGLDVSLDWSGITNSPNSTVQEIDDAVGKRHVHTNKASLDRITVGADDEILVDGQPATAVWSGSEW